MNRIEVFVEKIITSARSVALASITVYDRSSTSEQAVLMAFTKLLSEVVERRTSFETETTNDYELNKVSRLA